jgi:hypothetical protein
MIQLVFGAFRILFTWEERTMRYIRQFVSMGLLALLGLFLAACDSGNGGVVVDAQAPDFSLPADDGSTVSLQDYAGQPVLLYFHMAMG